MTWLRRKAKQLSLLALFALAVQLGLSFGHIHHDQAFAAKAAITQISVTQVSAPASDANHDADGNDVCAICAAMALANTLIDSVAPVLPVPAKVRSADLSAVAIATLAATQRAPFQSRAPPRS